uniref:Uncharacterized protein n=1 Tax=Daphnia galeata TaxID=27404 RepID=A0A8J2W699_9CRUS|nr:unnamed protein product [Daphnia galeata]
MNLPKWQAMLRALGGDREILKRLSKCDLTLLHWKKKT